MAEIKVLYMSAIIVVDLLHTSGPNRAYTEPRTAQVIISRVILFN